MEIKRRRSKIIKIGKVFIGGDHPIAIQSMTKVKSSAVDQVVSQIRELETAGCQIVRLAVKDEVDALAIKKIKNRVKLPLVADIHFSYKLALLAIENGADKIRLNPGNIDKPQEIRAVVSALKSAGIPLRIGLNSGSVKETGPAKSAMTDRLVTSCMQYVRRIEKNGFNKIVISLKANNVLDTVEAYRKVALACDYPLHLGLTATGSAYSGVIKSSVAIGALLLDGIGDTIRVSLTDEPQEEVRAAKCILESLGLFKSKVRLISCPTCGRCEVDLIKMVKVLEDKLASKEYMSIKKPLEVAVMGCVVNGPGEAKEADLGVAFGKGSGILFSRGRIVKKVPAKDCVKILLQKIKAA